ncbi:MAG: hypothetical protein QXS20_03945 [Candidatus Thorarchaeota archaeon]
MTKKERIGRSMMFLLGVLVLCWFSRRTSPILSYLRVRESLASAMGMTYSFTHPVPLCVDPVVAYLVVVILTCIVMAAVVYHLAKKWL